MPDESNNVASPDVWAKALISDWQADMADLSHDELSHYFQLFLFYWKRGGVLPDDDTVLARIGRHSRDEWVAIRPRVQSFFTISDGHWKHPRWDALLAEAHDNKARKQYVSKRGNEARWAKHRAEKAKNSVTHAGSMGEATQQSVGNFPSSESEAESLAALAGCEPSFARKVWLECHARGGMDAVGQPVHNFLSMLKGRVASEEGRGVVRDRNGRGHTVPVLPNPAGAF